MGVGTSVAIGVGTGLAVDVGVAVAADVGVGVGMPGGMAVNVAATPACTVAGISWAGPQAARANSSATANVRLEARFMAGGSMLRSPSTGLRRPKV